MPPHIRNTLICECVSLQGQHQRRQEKEERKEEGKEGEEEGEEKGEEGRDLALVGWILDFFLAGGASGPQTPHHSWPPASPVG